MWVFLVVSVIFSGIGMGLKEPIPAINYNNVERYVGIHAMCVKHIFQEFQCLCTLFPIPINI